MQYTKQEIGKVLKKMRLDAGLTQTEVAQKIGRNQPIVGHWENGYSQPDVNTLFILCDIYGVEDVSSAFGFEKEKTAPDKCCEGLSDRERAVALAYRAASEDDKAVVDAALKKYIEQRQLYISEQAI